MKRLRTSGRRQIATTACAIFLGLAVSAPAALAQHDDHADRILMPSPMYENSTAMLTEMERCKVYERRFDNSVSDSKKHSPQIDQAKVLRKQGGELCGKADYATGIQRLKEALDQIGVSSQL